MLEDESGRVRLVGERLKSTRLVTGIIIGALGIETNAGDFEVVDICFPGMAPQRSGPSKSLSVQQNGDVSMDIDCNVSLIMNIRYLLLSLRIIRQLHTRQKTNG